MRKPKIWELVCVPTGKDISNWLWSPVRLRSMRPARVPSASRCGRSTRPPAIACASSSSMKRPASPVAPEHKGRGYEVAKGQYLIVEDAELEAIEIESTHTIEIDRFVPRVVAFNTADRWMRDITADIARELRFRGAGGRVRARPSPRQWRRCRTAASSATTQAARRLKDGMSAA